MSDEDDEEFAYSKQIESAWACYRDAGRVPYQHAPAFYAGWHAAAPVPEDDEAQWNRVCEELRRKGPRITLKDDPELYNAVARALSAAPPEGGGEEAVKESPRQELLLFAETGRLRQECEGRLSEEATDLLVRVVLRYCEPRGPTLRQRMKRYAAASADADAREDKTDG